MKSFTSLVVVLPAFFASAMVTYISSLKGNILCEEAEMKRDLLLCSVVLRLFPILKVLVLVLWRQHVLIFCSLDFLAVGTPTSTNE
jgi:hypothetical protein